MHTEQSGPQCAAESLCSTWAAMPMGVRLKKMLWSRQAASQAALLDLRERRLLSVSSVGTTRWMKVATSEQRPSGLVSDFLSCSASSTSPCAAHNRLPLKRLSLSTHFMFFYC